VTALLRCVFYFHQPAPLPFLPLQETIMSDDDESCMRVLLVGDAGVGLHTLQAAVCGPSRGGKFKFAFAHEGNESTLEVVVHNDISSALSDEAKEDVALLVLCASVDSAASLEAATSKWGPWLIEQIGEDNMKAPVLFALKKDLRPADDDDESGRAPSAEGFTKLQGMDAVIDFDLAASYEFSALDANKEEAKAQFNQVLVEAMERMNGGGSNSNALQLKLMFVGSSEVGKTQLLSSFKWGEFDESAPADPSIEFEREDGEKVVANMWDTAGGEDYSRLRPLSYPQTDLFVLCYSVAEARSFVQLEEWVAEIKHHEPRVPFVLVALQTDLRDADGGDGKACITTAQGQAKAQALGAKAFHEVSNKTQAGVEEAKQAVFDAAVDAKKNPVEEEEDDATAAGAVAAADEAAAAAAAAAEEADDDKAEAAEMKRMVEGGMELAKQMLGVAVSVVQSAAAAAAAAPAPVVAAAASADESASASSKASASSSLSYADPSSVKYSLEQLKANAETRPADVDPARREAYLSDAHFREVFKMERDAFDKQAEWKRKQQKQAVGLF
jgi:small GTP-binding protein